MNPCFHAENTPWSSRKQEIRSSHSQCQQGTVASATVSLDKETQSQKHWAACSLGHRLSLLGYRKFIYCPECHDLLVCQKQAFFSHQKSSSPEPCGIQRKITLIAGNSSLRWVSARPCWGALCGSPGCTEPTFSTAALISKVNRHWLWILCLFLFFLLSNTLCTS